jgi:murein L,D-transpeptidase YafK
LERELVVFVKRKGTFVYDSLITYKFCSFSGQLGPKRQAGDMQIPEGFYYISYLNPYSNFYLSMKISYPNKSDKILGNKEHLGGDIFIHGNCVTIGCIPITDEKIKELYLLALYAKRNKQTIPVYLFPTRLSDENFNKLKDKYDKNLVDFWRNLKQGYDIFVASHRNLKYTIDSKGHYVFVK